MSNPKYPVSLGLTVEEYENSVIVRRLHGLSHREVYLKGLEALGEKENVDKD